MEKTKIDWCDSTWNPVTGCLHGCQYCYARNMAHRFSGGGENWTDEKIIILNEKVYGEEKAIPYPYGFTPTFHRYRLSEYKSKKSRNIFVCSMADLFGEWVPDGWIEEVFRACENAPQHNYLFLTKNPGRYVDLINSTDFFVKTKGNMWFGYSYTGKGCKQWWNPSYNIFASVEPILEPVEVPPCKWLIVGAETGRRKEKIIPQREWIEKIVEECRKSGIPVFMKSSLENIWKSPLIQEFPDQLRKENEQ